MKLRKILLFVLLLFPLLSVNCFQEAAPQPYFEELGVMLAAGEAPDVGFVDELRLPFYVANGSIQALPSDVVDDDFYPQLLQRFQRTDPASGEVATYALPQSFTTLALMVNITAFEEAGLEVPRSWDSIDNGGGELMAAAQELQKSQREAGNEDFYALGLTPELANWLPFFFQAGGTLYAQQGMRGIDSEPGRIALSLWVELVDQGFVTTSPITPEGWPYDVHDNLLEKFIDGKIGMMVVGGSHFDLVRDANPNFDVQVVELPAGPCCKATVSYVRGFALYRPNPTEGTVAFLQSLTSPQAMQETWMGNPMYIPPRPSLRSTWEEKYPDHKAFMAGVDYVAPLNLTNVAWSNLEQFDRRTADFLYSVMVREISVVDALVQIENLSEEYLLR
jgi:ABC-type glycerol-3-phosphate transport system substrate-binding protein